MHKAVRTYIAHRLSLVVVAAVLLFSILSGFIQTTPASAMSEHMDPDWSVGDCTSVCLEKGGGPFSSQVTTITSEKKQAPDPLPDKNKPTYPQKEARVTPPRKLGDYRPIYMLASFRPPDLVIVFSTLRF